MAANPPRDVTVLLYATLQCNLRCPYCVVNFRGESLDAARADAFSHFLRDGRRDAGRLSVEFFGGEPWLAKAQVRRIAESCADLGVSWKITTNGRLVSDADAAWISDRFASAYLSYNFQDEATAATVARLAKTWAGKPNVALTFIYRPDAPLERNVAHLRHAAGLGFSRINVLPVYFAHRWTAADFAAFSRFLDLLPQGQAYDYFYFNPSKRDAEFSVLPDGTLTYDTGETIYDMHATYGLSEKEFGLKFGNVADWSLGRAAQAASGFDVAAHVRRFADCGKVPQDWENFSRLSSTLYARRPRDV